MIHPEIWDDPDFAELGHSERLLFIGLFSLADDYGNITADPRVLGKMVFGFDGMDAQDVAHMLARITQHCPNVVAYEVGGKAYIHLNKWEDRQDLRFKAKPICPEFTQGPRKDLRISCVDLTHSIASQASSARKHSSKTPRLNGQGSNEREPEATPPAASPPPLALVVPPARRTQAHVALITAASGALDYQLPVKPNVASAKAILEEGFTEEDVAATCRHLANQPDGFWDDKPINLATVHKYIGKVKAGKSRPVAFDPTAS